MNKRTDLDGNEYDTKPNLAKDAAASESVLSDLLCVGGKYNRTNQSERLIYLGNNWSGNGYLHQFAKVESPEIVWCEVLYSGLKMIEKTKDT